MRKITQISITLFSVVSLAAVPTTSAIARTADSGDIRPVPILESRAVALGTGSTLPSLDVRTPAREVAVLRQKALEFIKDGENNRLARLDSVPGGDTHMGGAVRCLDLGGLNYCLGLGFGDRAVTVEELSVLSSLPATGGDSGLSGFVRQREELPPAVRAAAELRELDQAIAGLAKARAAQPRTSGVSEGQGKEMGLPTPNCIPDDSGGCTVPSYASSAYIMAGYNRRQERSYWCGPATLQMIDWADDKQMDSQASWASDLGTTTAGSSISAIVSQINAKTTWDVAAGSYIVQSVASWTASNFFDIHVRHLGDGTPAPIVEHLKESNVYIKYLHGVYGGHFEVGRGYSTSNATISVFDPYNEADWTSHNYQTAGPHSIAYTDLFNATLAGDYKNIGM